MSDYDREETNRLIKKYMLDPAFTALCKMEECDSCKGTGKGEEYDLPHSHCLSCNGRGYDWIPL